ncbi:MAG: DUF87 domain-containing protein [Gammaproteobacteria bacterium]|nr:DUF87 domain-containing protein [Gammaproteobacteria bacterium]
MPDTIAPWVRILVLALATSIAAIIARVFTGDYLPDNPREAIVFQHTLLLIVLGSAVLERFYTKPADSVMNSLMGLISLLSVHGTAPEIPWYVVTGYCVIVFVLSIVCVSVSSRDNIAGWRGTVAKLTYRPSVVFGSSRTLFSVVFLGALWFFYDIQEAITLALVIFWGLFLAIWPLRIPELLTAWFSRDEPGHSVTGQIVRVDSPNILRVALHGEARWSYDSPQIAVLPNRKAQWVQPLFSQFQDGRLLATGLLTGLEAEALPTTRNCVVSPSDGVDAPLPENISDVLEGGKGSVLKGFVVEHSTIGAIRFETLDAHSCYDGMLVWSNVSGSRVYYQIVSGETLEESFSADKHGFQVATATQLGRLSVEQGFTKVDWLPAMNSPVFSTIGEASISENAVTDADLVLGQVPRTGIKVGGDFMEGYDHHTAILGVTGSGKTELAFDVIRHAAQNGLKVVCIDLTAQYADRLRDLRPSDLSISDETARELGEKLFEVESGAYGAGAEKKALQEFSDTVRNEVNDSIADFMAHAETMVGLIQLGEISNTKATLWITETYMTCLLRYAMERVGQFSGTLIVVEEAHTVMPEASTMGLGDFESKGLVGKIAQIALQGRKYGVGLLILAQRTATVSKTVLTQCNTIITFSCYDDTSLGFLRNIYGPEHIDLIPNLPRLHAVAFGKWIRSERPLMFEVPFDESKARQQENTTTSGSS